MIRIILADDELLARKRLIRLLEPIDEVELVAVCISGTETLQALQQHDADILLLDIQMPGLNGLETGRLIPDGGPSIIFVTAHPEHALSAFDVGAVDYVVKPVEPQRLAAAIERAARRQREVRDTTRLPVQTGKGVIMLDPADIQHIDYDGYLVTLHTASQSITTTASLTELEEQLPGDHFVRVHRRHILNINCVIKLEPLPTGGYVAHTKTGDQIPIARQPARELRKRFEL